MSHFSIVETALQQGGVVRQTVILETGEIVGGKDYCNVPPGREEAGTDAGGLSTAHISRIGGSVDCYLGGGLIKVVKPRIKVSQKGGGRRSSITGFSRSSRRRLMRTIASIKKQDLPIFLTLTYPGEYPGSPTEWKRHLKNFISRLTYKCQGASGIWKLEPQKRGAPHYHLLVWGASFMQLREFVPLAWYEVVGSDDIRHFRAGTRVEKVRSWGGVMAYASKYLGKEVENLPGWEKVGRYWGVFQRLSVPWAPVATTELNYGESVQLIRLLRRYAKLKGRDYKSLTVFVNSPDFWFDRLHRLC